MRVVAPFSKAPHAASTAMTMPVKVKLVTICEVEKFRYADNIIHRPATSVNHCCHMLFYCLVDKTTFGLHISCRIRGLKITALLNVLDMF